MATLVLENLPADVMNRLEELAVNRGSSVPVEAAQLLRRLLPDAPFLTEEIPAPCDLRLPVRGVRVLAKDVAKRFPPPFSLSPSSDLLCTNE